MSELPDFKNQQDSSEQRDLNDKQTLKPIVASERSLHKEPIVSSEPTADLPPYRQTESKVSSSKLPVWLIPVMLAILIGGVLLGRYWGANSDVVDEPQVATAQTSDSAVDSEQAVLSVETVTPNQDDIGNTLRADGTISAKDTANVSAKVNGVAIVSVLVEEGQRVKAGQVLAVFDTDAVQQQILQGEADVVEAEATLANAKSDAARVLPLIDIDAISKQEADRYRTSELRAQAALQASRARLSNQRLSLNNATVTAPVSGIISAKMIEVGQVAGAEPLFTIIKDGILEWQADIDPKLIGEVKVGTPVKVSLPQDQSVMGQVERIAPTAGNNRQITIYASLAASSAVRAGMYQTGEFLLGSSNIQTLPNSAIVSNDGYDYVMLLMDIKTDKGVTVGRIKQQRVTLGERFGANVAVTEPLPANSRLVKQGGSFLNEGDLVRIVDNDSNANKADATSANSQTASPVTKVTKASS